MTSQRRLLANRHNGMRSTGPRSREGKMRASRNAVRHGLASALVQSGPDREQIIALAQAICPADDALCYEQAVLVAECHHTLQRVHAARAAALESAKMGATNAHVIPLLNQLERYERRTWSRRRRAMELLDAMREVRRIRESTAC